METSTIITIVLVITFFALLFIVSILLEATKKKPKVVAQQTINDVSSTSEISNLKNTTSSKDNQTFNKFTSVSKNNNKIKFNKNKTIK